MGSLTDAALSLRIVQNTSKFGVGIMVEAADPELMEQQQQQQQAAAAAAV